MTHEVFLRVLRHSEVLPNEDAEMAWVQRICMNYCLNVIRSRKLRTPEMAVGEDFYEGPERRLANRDFAERVLERTPEKIASAARLYYVDGLEQQSVAEALKVTRRTVCTRLEQFLSKGRELRREEDKRWVPPQKSSERGGGGSAAFG